jgi:hypothetical protein
MKLAGKPSAPSDKDRTSVTAQSPRQVINLLMPPFPPRQVSRVFFVQGRCKGGSDYSNVVTSFTK